MILRWTGRTAVSIFWFNNNARNLSSNSQIPKTRLSIPALSRVKKYRTAGELDLYRLYRASALYNLRVRELKKKQVHSTTVINMFLGEDYVLPEDAILEITSPILWRMKHLYFQKLVHRGRALLELHIETYLMTGNLTRRREGFLNGVNFREVEKRFVEGLNSRQLLEIYCQEVGLTNALNVQGADSDKRKVYHSVESLCLLVGAVYEHHGTTKLANLVQTKVLEGAKGLLRLSLRATS